MDVRVLDELLLKERLLYVKLAEFEDLTRQLAEALDRRDEISVQMLLNMRAEPANQLQEADRQLRSRLLELPEEDAIRAIAKEVPDMVLGAGTVLTVRTGKAEPEAFAAVQGDG
jgi:hypothetical protein